jgi:hypothetical protein
MAYPPKKSVPKSKPFSGKKAAPFGAGGKRKPGSPKTAKGTMKKKSGPG